MYDSKNNNEFCFELKKVKDLKLKRTKTLINGRKTDQLTGVHYKTKKDD